MVDAGDRLAVECDEDVAFMQSSPLGRTVRLDRDHQDPALNGEAAEYDGAPIQQDVPNLVYYEVRSRITHDRV